MAIYLKKFETQSAYEAAQSSLILPNVSLTVDNNTVHYNPSTPPTPVETRLVCKYNVVYTEYTTALFASLSVDAMEIDGVEQSEVVNYYQFDTIGEHTVKYTLTDPTSIDEYAFENCGNLTSIDIPNGVTSIGGNAFFECIGLTSITIPNSVISIDMSAFYNCIGLTSCTIGSGVTSIGDSTFQNCSSLTNITINATTPPTLGGTYAFDNNAEGRKIYVPSGSVDVYKAATNWSTYANYIEPIS